VAVCARPSPFPRPGRALEQTVVDPSRLTETRAHQHTYRPERRTTINLTTPHRPAHQSRDMSEASSVFPEELSRGRYRTHSVVGGPFSTLL